MNYKKSKELIKSAARLGLTISEFARLIKKESK